MKVPPALSWREALLSEMGLLAEWNHPLIRDEGHRNAMTVEQLAGRIRLTVDVLCQNPAGLGFWRSVGYRDYCLTLEIIP